MRIGEAFPSDYLKAADLKGKAVKVVIESVTTEKIGDDQKPVLHFVGKDKALVLNKTNANRIVEATESDETDDWEGWTITLYPTKVDYQGKRVDAIRIDDRPGSAVPPEQDEEPGAPEPEPLTDDDIPF